MKLELDDIVSAALRTLDEEGLAALSMRGVASRLRVRASALYWHVQDKDALLWRMAGRFYAQSVARVPAGLAWRAWLLRFGQAFRDTLVAHRDAALLCAAARPVGGDAEARIDEMAAPLVAAGLPREQALSFLASVISLVLGWCVYEQNEAMHAHLDRMIGFDRSFATGLAALVAGFPDAAPAAAARA